MAFPKNICFAEPLEGTTKIRNTSKCKGEFRAKFLTSANNLPNETTDVVEIPAGGTGEFKFSLDSFPDSPVSIEQAVEVKIGDNFKSIASRVSDIKPLFSDFQIVSAPYPENAQPGDEVSANITIQNIGDCKGKARAKGTKLPPEGFNLGPGETTSFRHTLSMPGEAQPIQLSLNNVTQNSAADTFGTKVEPSSAVLIDTEKGTLRMIGGFSTQVPYAGAIQATNLEKSNMEEDDKLAAGRRIGTFQGKVSVSPSDEDIIKFDTLDYLNMRFDKQIQWVFDGTIKGKAESFQYSEYPTSGTESFLPAPAENPEISIRGSPLTKLGRARKRLGVNSQLFSEPIVNRG